MFLLFSFCFSTGGFVFVFCTKQIKTNHDMQTLLSCQSAWLAKCEAFHPPTSTRGLFASWRENVATRLWMGSRDLTHQITTFFLHKLDSRDRRWEAAT